MDGPLTNEDVLGRHIPWESYKVTGQISERDFALIKRLDKSSETAKASALEEVRLRHSAYAPRLCTHRMSRVCPCWTKSVGLAVQQVPRRLWWFVFCTRATLRRRSSCKR